MYELIYTGIIGVLVYGLLRWLDRAMDYGHALGFIRFSLFALNANIKQKRDLIIARNSEDQITATDAIYWAIARHKAWMKILICINCQIFWAACISAFAFDLNVLILIGAITLVSLWR